MGISCKLTRQLFIVLPFLPFLPGLAFAKTEAKACLECNRPVSSLSSLAAQTQDLQTILNPRKIRVIGVVSSGRKGFGAVIQDESSGAQKFYKVGRVIEGVGLLKQVRRDGIVIQNGQNDEIVRLHHTNQATAVVVQPEQKPQVEKKAVAPARSEFDRSEIQQVTANRIELLNTIKASPVYENNQMIGIKFDSLTDESFFRSMGLQPSDVVTEINGKKVESLAELMGFINRLPNEQTVNFEVKRGGQPVKIDFQIH